MRTSEEMLYEICGAIWRLHRHGYLQIEENGCDMDDQAEHWRGIALAIVSEYREKLRNNKEANK